MTEQEEKENLIKLRRLFRNPQGNWAEVEKRCKSINSLAALVQSLTEDLIKANNKLEREILEAYELAPLKDSLYYDCPIGPAKQTLYLRMFLKKLGWDGIRDVWVEPVAIQEFAKHIKEGTRWLLKFKDKSV